MIIFNFTTILILIINIITSNAETESPQPDVQTTTVQPIDWKKIEEFNRITTLSKESETESPQPDVQTTTAQPLNWKKIDEFHRVITLSKELRWKIAVQSVLVKFAYHEFETNMNNIVLFEDEGVHEKLAIEYYNVKKAIAKAERNAQLDEEKLESLPSDLKNDVKQRLVEFQDEVATCRTMVDEEISKHGTFSETDILNIVTTPPPRPIKISLSEEELKEVAYMETAKGLKLNMRTGRLVAEKRYAKFVERVKSIQKEDVPVNNKRQELLDIFESLKVDIDSVKRQGTPDSIKLDSLPEILKTSVKKRYDLFKDTLDDLLLKGELEISRYIPLPEKKKEDDKDEKISTSEHKEQEAIIGYIHGVRTNMRLKRLFAEKSYARLVERMEKTLKEKLPEKERAERMKSLYLNFAQDIAEATKTGMPDQSLVDKLSDVEKSLIEKAHSKFQRQINKIEEHGKSQIANYIDDLELPSNLKTTTPPPTTYLETDS